MEVIYLLVPLSLAFLGIAIWIFFWAVRTAQFEDLEGPAHRLILDDREEQATRQARADDRKADAAVAARHEEEAP